MSNKTRNLARNLLALMALGASAGAVPGVNAAETAKSAKTETKKETVKTEKAAAAAKGGIDVKSGAIGAVPGAVVGGAVTFGLMKLFGGGAKYLMNADGKTPNYMATMAQTAAEELVSKQLSEDAKKNVVKGDYCAIPYAIVASAVLQQQTDNGANANKPKDTAINLIYKQKTLKKATDRAANGLLKYDQTVEDDKLEDLPASIEIKCEEGFNIKDAADQNNRPVNDLVAALCTKAPLLMQALKEAKATIKLEKTKLTVTINGKTIVMDKIAADGTFKDTTVTVS